MYKIGKGRPRWKRRTVAFTIVLVIGIGAIVAFLSFVKHDADQSTVVQSKSGGTRVYNPDDSEKKLVVDEPLYSFQLPGDWKVSKRNEDPRYTSVEWQMGKKPQNRWITIYVDKFPADLPVNRLFPAAVTGNKISENSPSDACNNFTTLPDKNPNVKVVKAPSRWQNVDFMCEMDNIYNNVAAVGTPESGTTLSITGTSQGNHKYLILYKDHSIPSDDSPFREALQSFTAK